MCGGLIFLEGIFTTVLSLLFFKKYLCALSLLFALSGFLFFNNFNVLMVTIAGTSMSFTLNLFKSGHINKVFYLEENKNILARKVLISYNVITNLVICALGAVTFVILLFLNNFNMQSNKYKEKRRINQGLFKYLSHEIWRMNHRWIFYSVALIYFGLYLFYSTVGRIINLILFFIRVRICVVKYSVYLVNMFVFGVSLGIFYILINLITLLIKYNCNVFKEPFCLFPTKWIKKYCTENIDELIYAVKKEKHEYFDLYEIVVPKGKNNSVEIVRCNSFKNIFYYFAFTLRMYMFKIRYDALMENFEYEKVKKEQINKEMDEINKNISIKF